ncbi:MAG: hypothetical protein A2Y10_00830 [Planctomycetes bacterium GWF2_41_51]|nr:MAG: hypothetical protein A2Y10_00830 [Planctomycetes bacterium GWF2_41_51]HBG26756.1 hypothetical protein [Phycisphaerales bacterium]
MDYNHSKRLLNRIIIAALVIVIFLWETAAFGAIYSSFGSSVNKSFGPPEQKEVWIETSVFIPISGKIIDLNLALDLNHTSFCDLVIMIESPSGISPTISGYDEYDFIPAKNCRGWVTLDEQSRVTVNSAKSLSNNSYKPNAIEPLSSLNGRDAYGLWTIKICDAIYYDTGILKNIRIDLITAPETFAIIPEPASMLLLVSGAFNFFRMRG